MDLNLRSDSGKEDTFSVTIIDQYSRTHIEHQAEVDFVTLNLMLQAEYVTVRETTIKKKATKVDDKGSVFFYGNVTDESII
ncbi:hypothetical protein [Lysinibacillus agricola]|uniref:hypothetical protein n=1 Tax=Lysinibacillus agricola TaxID=2590012 RepID=UPI003C25B652